MVMCNVRRINNEIATSITLCPHQKSFKIGFLARGFCLTFENPCSTTISAPKKRYQLFLCAFACDDRTQR